MFEEPDQTSSSAAVGNNPTSSNSLPPPPDPLADRYDTSVPPPPVPVPALPDPALAAVLAAKAMIESQLPPPSATPGMYVFFLALLAFFGQFWLLFGTFCNSLAAFDQELPALPDLALAAVLAAKAMIESQLPPPSATPGMYFLEVFGLFLGNFGYFLALSANSGNF